MDLVPTGDRETLRAALLESLPSMPYGAPGTNVTLPPATAARIESAAAQLEAVTPYPTGLARNAEASTILNGSWRLLYTNAPEITSLASLPLGFQLGEVFQPIDIASGTLENQAAIKHSLGLASGATRVLATLQPAAVGSLNDAGIVNKAGNRVNVDFERVIFALDRVLSFSTERLLRKVVSPQVKATAAQPAVDITYLDQNLRITRGGDASLFVLVREESPLPMLRADAKAELLAEGSTAKPAGPELTRELGGEVIMARGV